METVSLENPSFNFAILLYWLIDFKKSTTILSSFI